MFKTVSRMMIAVAAVGLALGPVAAQAGTRAGDNDTVYAQGEKKKKKKRGAIIWWGGGTVLLTLAATGLFLGGAKEAADQDNGGQSPGT